MDSYIVRVYRRAGREAADIAGLVEEVETRHEKPFHNATELVEILTKQEDRSRAGKEKGNP